MSDWSWIQSVPDWAKYLNGFLIGFFVNWLTSYMTQKGKNLATKEDIGELTRRTEEARREYVHEVERLRNDLIILREELTSVRAKGREAVVDLFEKCNVLKNEYLTDSIGNAGFHKGEDVGTYSRSLAALILDIRLAYYRILVYFYEDDSLGDLAGNVFEAVHDLRFVIEQNIGPVIIANMQFKSLDPNNIREEEVRSKAKREQDAVVAYHKAIEPYSKKFDDAFSGYGRRVRAFFKQIHLKSEG